VSLISVFRGSVFSVQERRSSFNPAEAGGWAEL
jgi:hypothetical protein